MGNQRGLTRLIAASRVTNTGDGTTGESFLNNVTGSGATVSMSNYIMTSSTWSNTPSAPPTSYTTPHTFTNLTLTFNTFGTKASLIQDKSTTNWATSYISPLSTATSTLNSISWSGGVGTLNLTINGEVTPGSPVESVTVWYQGYTNPYLPYGGSGNTDPSICSPDCETAYNVNFTFSAGAVAASGSTTNELYLSYGPDRFNVGFNHAVFGPGPTAATSWQILQNRGPGATPTIDAVEWATDSGFTNIVSTTVTHTISSDNNTDPTNGGQFYLRYKLNGAGSFTNWSGNPVQWTDPRNDT